MFKKIRDLSSIILTVLVLGAIAFSQDRILYTTLRPANWDIYLFDGPGSEPRRLTDDPALDYNPVFSPDGRWVVFCSERRGNPDLYALDLKKGGQPRLLTDNDSMEDAPAFSPDGRRIVFVSTRDGNADIFTMRFDSDDPKASSKAVNLTRGAGGDFNPAFSPDGRRIVFSSDRAHATGLEAFQMMSQLMKRGGPDEFYKYPMNLTSVYVMDADGKNVKRLTQQDSVDGSPVWSADGKSVYFYSKRRGDKNFRIWRMNADGTDPHPVSADIADRLSPAATREGRVAFSTRINDRWQIVSIASDGGDQRSESDTRNQYWAPDFDPKSRRMVCYGTAPFEDAPQAPTMSGPAPFLVWEQREEKKLPGHAIKLYASRGAAFPSFNPSATELVSGFEALTISEIDGGNMRVIYHSKEGPSWSPDWSKDGQWIVFNVGGHFAGPAASAHIWKIRPDGSGAVNLTAGSKGNNAFPAFSPDGRQIVFRSSRDGNHEIYLMDADGKNPRRLTDNPATDTMPTFSPKGDQIAFVSNREDGYQIYTIDIDDEGGVGQARRVTNALGLNMHPRYSPDGEWLIFTSDRGGFNDESPLVQETMFLPQPYGDLYAMRLKDGFIQRLTHNKWEDGLGTWARNERRP
jgi:Tol biopolymer transport system component